MGLEHIACRLLEHGGALRMQSLPMYHEDLLKARAGGSVDKTAYGCLRLFGGHAVEIEHRLAFQRIEATRLCTTTFTRSCPRFKRELGFRILIAHSISLKPLFEGY